MVGQNDRPGRASLRGGPDVGHTVPAGSRTAALVSSSWAKVAGANAMHTPLPVHISRSTVIDGRPLLSCTRRRRRVGRSEAVQLLGVPPEKLVLGLRREMADHLLGRGETVGPGRVRVGIVSLAHDVVLADLVDARDPVMVLNEAAEHMVPEQLAYVEVVEVDVGRGVVHELCGPASPSSAACRGPALPARGSRASSRSHPRTARS